jgi:hypothetical protein
MISKLLFSLILSTIPYVFALSEFSSTKPITDGLGVNIHFTSPQVGEIEMIAAAGFKWVRMDFFWEATEKKKGEYDFKEYENLMTELQKHNMSALLVFDYGNKLYGEKSLTTEEGRKGYAHWAATAADHFKGRGIIWEIYNEPNGDNFWYNHHDVQQYIAMALEAVKAIRAKTPDEIIIGPALTSVELAFLDECFKAGLLNYWDAVSVHPYRQTGPETVISDYNEVKKLIAKYAPKGKTIPIISGEWGYSSVWNGFNDAAQAKYLTRELITNSMNGVPVSIWYDWRNDGTNNKEGEHNFGLVLNEYHSGANPVFTPKESYFFAKTLSSVLKGYHYVKRIATDNVNDYIVLFSDGKNLKLAVWTTIAQAHQVSIPSDKCDFEIIDPKGVLNGKFSSDGGFVKFTINDVVHYIAVKGPNHALENAADANLFNANIVPVSGKTLLVKINNLKGGSVNGTVSLTDVTGIEPLEKEMKFQFSNEFEKDIVFKLKNKPESDFKVGLKVEAHGSVQNFQAHKYQFIPSHSFSDCIIRPEGDPKVPSEQSLTIHSAPEPLFDSDSPTFKIDYHFMGKGWKFLVVHPNKPENRKITGEPQAFGLWVYGDGHNVGMKMQINDATQQTFQIRPNYGFTIDWKGWKYVMFDLINAVSYWGGANDGKVHYPVEWATLFLLESDGKTDIKSTVYISPPVIVSSANSQGGGEGFKTVIMPIHGKKLSVKIQNPNEVSGDGIVRLKDFKGIDPTVVEMNFHLEKEYEKVITFSLNSKPENEFTVGLEIDSHGNKQTFESHKYKFLSDSLVNDLIMRPEGDAKVQSEQYLMVRSAPEPLSDSDSPVQELDYHFFGQGWKFLIVYPNKTENRQIPDQPKAFGIWVYGDEQKMNIKMQIHDSSNQTFQYFPDSPAIDWKGWKYIVFDLKEPKDHWGGKNDGVVHYPIEWATTFLLENSKQTDTKSRIYISAPLMTY